MILSHLHLLSRRYVVSLVFLPFASLFIFSCAAPIKMYTGVEKPSTETATFLMGGMSMPDDLLYTVDGIPGSAFLFGQNVYCGDGAMDKSIKLVLLPGNHTIEVARGRGSPVTTLSFDAVAGRQYVIQDVRKSDCIKIVDKLTDESASSVACPESTTVLCDSKATNDCANLKFEKELFEKSLFVYKIDGHWNSKAHLGWNYYNSSMNGALDIRLPPGEHTLEIGYSGGGQRSLMPQKITISFESGKTYLLGAEVNADTWKAIIKTE